MSLVASGVTFSRMAPQTVGVDVPPINDAGERGGGSVPTFRIWLDTSSRTRATDQELTSAFETISAAGGIDVSLMPHNEIDRPRASFSLEADDRPQLMLDVRVLLASLLVASPAVRGGWSLIAISPN
jgi:hypothetical protein